MRKAIHLLNSDGSSDIAIGTGGFYTVSLPASGWVEQSNGTFAQTASIPGLQVTDRAVVDINLAIATTSTYATLREAWFLIGRAYTVSNGITFVCYDGSAPGTNLLVNVEVL